MYIKFALVTLGTKSGSYNIDVILQGTSRDDDIFQQNLIFAVLL